MNDFNQRLNELERHNYIGARSMDELFIKLREIKLPCALLQVVPFGNRIFAIVKFDREIKIERKRKKTERK